MNISFLLGRVLFGGFFLQSGMNHLRPAVKEGMAQYAGSKGVPYPELAVTGSGVVMALGGASILTGLLPKWGTAAIAMALAGMTPTMHDFWNADESHAQSEIINFSKNAALLGAALVLLSVEEPWPASLSRSHNSE